MATPPKTFEMADKPSMSSSKHNRTQYSTLSEKKDKTCHWGCTFSKGTLLYPKAAYWYLSAVVHITT